jgi:outer membrane protein, heavy metal efflux system
MKIKIAVLTIWILCFTVSAQAGFKEMKDAYASYRPSPYFDSQLRAGKEAPSPGTDDLFQEEVKRLHDTRTKWEALPKERNRKGTFAGIDPDLLLALSAARSDADAAAAAIGFDFSKETLEALVLLRNSSIDSAEKRFQAAIEQISQITHLDEILRQYGAFTQGLMTGIGPMKGKDPVNMKFPFPGVMALKSQVVGKEIEVARLDLEIAIRDATTSIRKSYWNYLYVRKDYDITHELLTLLGHLEKVATTRYESGKTSYQDVIKVRINRETLREKLTTLKERQKNIEINILALLNLPSNIRLGNPKPSKMIVSVPDLSTLYGLAKGNRQEINQMRAKIGKMEIMLELAETMILPPFTLNLSLYENDAIRSVGTFNNKETFPISTPATRGAGLPKNAWYGANDAYLRQTRQNLNALIANLKSVEDKTTMLVRNTWFDLERSQREESLFANTVVDLSQLSRNVSITGYESGNVMFADVFESYNIWFKAKLTLERKRSDIGIFWAELERVLGKQLPGANKIS